MAGAIGRAYHKSDHVSHSPTGKGWPKGKPREHRIDKDVEPGDKFLAKWATEVRAELDRSLARRALREQFQAQWDALATNGGHQNEDMA